MQTNDLIATLTRQFISTQTSAFYINGSRGSGKTWLLNNLAVEMPRSLNSLLVLGPYQVTEIADFTKLMLNDLASMGYIDNSWNQDIELDWYSTWKWIRENITASKNQNILVLLDVNFKSFTDYENMGVWFSSIRYLQHYWDLNNTRLLFVVSGSWNHNGLEGHFHLTQTSFPYTESTSYLVWHGISLEETIGLVKRKFSDSKMAKPLGKMLFEITDGHPGAIDDVLSFVDSKKTTAAEIQLATEKAAQNGKHGKLLIGAWTNLHSDVIDLAKQFVLMKQTPKSANHDLMNLLFISGIIVYHDETEKRYGKIKSWYVELLIRNNASLLGISGEDWMKIEFEEFVPSIKALNIEAYELINNIENIIRNFAVSRLFEQRDDTEHILKNHVLKNNKYIQADDDAYDRASGWRQKNFQIGVGLKLNPLIAYISTGDLIQLIKEIPIDGVFPNELITSMEAVSPIRDAVMHNQIIDEKSLGILYDLQDKILKVL